MQELLDVFQNYAATRTLLKGKAIASGTPDQVSLTQSFPAFFSSILAKQGRLNEFKVQGSFGSGVIANVPWVAVFNRAITKSAQNGYYIVLLFAEDMGACYLSLNQGVTTLQNTYGSKVAKQKLKDASLRARHYFDPNPFATLGSIDLKATGHLGQGYERGAIESFSYDISGLPSSKVLEEHFLILLEHYDALVTVTGLSLETLTPVTEVQYQYAALEKAEKSDHPLVEPDGPQGVPPKSSRRGTPAYPRNPAVAALALKKAVFQCEIDGDHKTFVSSAKGHPYVEAHHLIPMSHQAAFGVALDVVANVVALCPNCHRLLHHGQSTDKQHALKCLFNHREGELRKKGVHIDWLSLCNMYRRELLEDEA